MASKKIASRVEEIFSHSRDACEQALRGMFDKQGGVLPGAAIKVHLRNFASFNTTFGYQKGEQLLREVAQYLTEVCEHPIYRQGSGVSFILLVPDQGMYGAAELAEKIAERFEHPWQLGSLDCVCTACVGVVLYPDYASAPDDLLHNLDLAIDQSTKGGHNKVTLFGPELQDRFYRDAVIIRLLTSAIENDQINIRYRPVWSLGDESYTRIECASRLLTVEFGPVRQSEFLPLAEESGVAYFVNMHVIRRACRAIQELTAKGVQFESMSVELSPVLLPQRGFVNEVAALLDEYRVPYKKLALEVYDHPMSAHCIRPVVEKLSSLGVEIVLGGVDFGFSGLRDILTLPVDAIKLGRMSVWQLETNPRSGAVVQGLIQIAASLGIKLIAEGVETDYQNSLLGRYRCPYRQGLYYSHSLSIAELEELFASPQLEDRP